MDPENVQAKFEVC